MTTNWQAVPGTADFTWNDWVAVYTRTERGYARYKVYAPDGYLYSVGGLPERLPAGRSPIRF